MDAVAGVDQLGVTRHETRRRNDLPGWAALRKACSAPATSSPSAGMPRSENADGPRPLVRTCSPKEADVARDDGRRAGEIPGPRPFLGRRAS